MAKPILASSPAFWRLRGYDLSKREISYLSLNQPPVCDCDCQRCFDPIERKICALPNLLSMPDYIRILDEFKHHGGIAVEISGEGEPLLSPHLLPILRYASKLDLWTTLITNGHILSEEVVMELSELKVALVLSLHTLDERAYEIDNKKPGSFKDKMRAIELAGRIFTGLSWLESEQTIMRTCIHYTLQMNNLTQVDEVKKMCADLGFHFSIAPLAPVGNATKQPDLWLPKDYCLEEVNDQGDESIIFWEEESGRKVCGTCRYGLNIGADGELLLDAHGGYNVRIANIRDISFAEAIRLQYRFSKKMFSELSSFCPLRDPGWDKYLEKGSFF